MFYAFWCRTNRNTWGITPKQNNNNNKFTKSKYISLYMLSTMELGNVRGDDKKNIQSKHVNSSLYFVISAFI